MEKSILYKLINDVDSVEIMIIKEMFRKLTCDNQKENEE